MELRSGEKLGPYEILSRIGAGGMGQVWKARDTRLNRFVAIKTSHARFSERFEREARAVAALNHPHICTLYDVGADFLVMEYVEGAEIKGPLPLDQALKYSIQLASALEAAHQKLITHRDLKPANILLTKAGIKVLDFGLAKFEQPTTLAEDDATLTGTLTQEGAIVGTLQYMAPEQLQGKPTDVRADIFSFGCVLYEILTGKRAFDAGNEASVIAAILERPAPSVGEAVPALLGWTLEQCLAKDPNDRWQSASDLKKVLERTLVSAPSTVIAKKGGRLPVWAASVAIAVGVSILGWAFFRPKAEETPVGSYRLDIPAPSGTTFLHNYGTAISPDGRMVAFVAGSRTGRKIWVRSLDAREAQEVPGTEEAGLPFWSPDSKSLGFFGGGKLQRVELAGGTPRPICDVVTGGGAAWSSRGVILFNAVNDGPLLRVSAEGGSPSRFTTIDKAQGENSHRYPQLLPDGRHFIYFVRGTDYVRGTSWASGEYVGSLDDPGQKTKILSSRTEAIFAPGAGSTPPSLLYLREDGTLVAQTLDVERFQLLGEPTVLAKGLSFRKAGSRLIDVSAAAFGTIVYGTEGTNQFQLTWLSRQGDRTGTIGETGRYTGLRISPDGKRVAVLQDMAVWQIELARGVATKVADGDFNPVWSPDGSRIVYTIGAPPNLFARDAQTIATEQRLSNSEQSQIPMDWSPDGRFLLYSATTNDLKMKNRLGLWTLAMQGSDAATAFTSSPFRETNGQFSPDGKWIAYVTDESGGNEILVRSFPDAAHKWQVSIKGGNWVRWRRDGKELFYLAPDGKFMSVSVHAAHGELGFTSPEPLFDFPNHSLERSALSYAYDVAPDGRFLVLTPVGSEAHSLTVITNWLGSGTERK
jgi:Tol biopolymer transport system component/tRNA A-37 threonylcarbamoyl transferase component Bud32